MRGRGQTEPPWLTRGGGGGGGGGLGPPDEHVVIIFASKPVVRTN